MNKLSILSKSAFSILFLLLIMDANAQTFSDHNDKTLFNLLPQSSFSYEVGGTSASLTYLFGRHKKYTYYKGSSPSPLALINIAPPVGSNYTTADNSLWFVTGSVSDINKDYKSFFTYLNQPTISVGIAYALNNTLWMNWAQLDHFKQWNSYIKLFANNTISDYYDVHSSKRSAASTWPLFNFGVEGNFTNFSSKTVWINLIGSITHGMPTDGLKSYQNSIPTPITTTDPIVVPIGDGAGHYGDTLNKNQWSYRFAFTPTFFFKDKSPICFFPFYETYGISSNRWTNIVGASIGILGKPFDISKASISPVLQLGIDWNTNATTKNGWSTPNYILSFKGTFGN
jgi:hypothetical protein